MGGVEGAKKTRLAAELRERIWRLERREPDALEALELYRVAAKLDPTVACDAAVDRALLRGELEADPASAYQSLYVLRSQKAKADCARRADRALASLEAFRPPDSVLASLMNESGEPVDDSTAIAGAHVKPDPSGAIVVPKVLDRKASRITSVEHYGGKEAARVVVYVTHPAVFEVGGIPKTGDRGPRLYVDIKGARYRGSGVVAGDGVVQRVRMGQRKGAARVVLDLEAPVYRKIFYLPEPFRLIIDVSKEPPKAEKQEGPREVKRVVLDPGHGGEDPGAVGPGGLREKDVALDIAHRAAPLVARELRVSALLTRDEDVFIPLDERVARANAFGADLFVSIHCNASELSTSNGITTFVLDASRDDLAARVAARENAASPAAAAELANIMSRVIDEASLAQSNHFAKLLQRSAMGAVSPRYTDVDDLGVRSAGFYVLAGARMPAVLFEASFISHPVEEMRLNTGHYRQKMADAIVNAIRAYREGL